MSPFEFEFYYMGHGTQSDKGQDLYKAMCNMHIATFEKIL